MATDFYASISIHNGKEAKAEYRRETEHGLFGYDVFKVSFDNATLTMFPANTEVTIDLIENLIADLLNIQKELKNENNKHTQPS